MKRNWSSLTKEQKQIVVLIAFGVLIIGVVLHQFVLTPLLESGEKRRQDAAKLRDDIAKADEALKREVREQMEFTALKAQLARLTQTAVVPYGSGFAWVTEQLYLIAKEAGVELGGLSGSGQPLGAPLTPEPGGRTFSAFSAQLTLQCGYADLLRFLRVLEEQQPLVTVVNLTMDGRDQTPTRHQVNLTLEWPVWTQPLAAPAGKQALP